jgi:hypothetical protein
MPIVGDGAWSGPRSDTTTGAKFSGRLTGRQYPRTRTRNDIHAPCNCSVPPAVCAGGDRPVPMEAILRDAIRLVPELAPLCADRLAHEA